MLRSASAASSPKARKLTARSAATRIAAFLVGRDDEQKDRDDDDDLPRPNATASGFFPQLRFARPAVA